MLLDAQPPKPASRLRKFGLIIVLAAVALGGAAWHQFRNYPEERAVARFLSTLEVGDYQEAYRLWQPSSSYTFQDFQRDWGEHGDYGKIRQFQILGSRTKGQRTVIVTVRINSVDPPLDLVVDRQTKGLAYSAF